MGHSMGGGLSFPIAAGDYCKEIDYVFTMAPAYGVEEFDPISKGVKKYTAPNTTSVKAYYASRCRQYALFILWSKKYCGSVMVHRIYTV